MSSAPQIPPRPGRAQGQANEALQNAPIIPPRPQRRADRSISPARAEYSRSPLNDLPAQTEHHTIYGTTLSSSDLPKRPSSAYTPGVVGEEGQEYASYDRDVPVDDHQHSGSPGQTRNVAADLPMHAPTASVPQSTAKSRIQTVTRTDSSQAAAAGFGKSPDASSTGDVHPLKARSSFSRSNLSLGGGRAGSIHGDEEEHGPPSMGLTVPMLKYAGDAQAPSPAPSSFAGTPGQQGDSRNHHRKKSSRNEFAPPGSYGLHGHGLNSFHGITEPKDKFERDWYQKHPEEYKREQGRVYDPGHPSHDWALSSDDLNKLVHQSSSRGIGMGTTPEAIGTPSEQIGYLASEEYASRMNSPRPGSAVGRKRVSSGRQPAVSSPLRATFESEYSTGNEKNVEDDHALESENEDIIHVDAPAHRTSKIGGGGYDPPTEDFGPRGGNTEEEGGWVIENGYGVPILASDEVAKNQDPSAEYMQPAVSPEQEKRGGDYYAGWDSEAPPSYQTGRRSSREPSRASSSHGEPLSRVRTHDGNAGSVTGTPLEEIQEYEPLFPDDDKEPLKPKTIENLRRPDLARHHFPSQDVWEDTPESLQYHTTVDTPQEPEELSASTTFEHPAKEAARKDGPLPEDRADFLSDEAQRMAKPHFKPGVMDEVRPHLNQRFPSQDIWEDTPDSLQYQTTVDTPQSPDDMESSTGTLPPPEDAKPEHKFNHTIADERKRPDYRNRFPSSDIWEDSPNSLHLETTVSGPQTPEDDIVSPESARSPQATFGKPTLPARPARPSKLAEEVKQTPEIPSRPPQRLRQVPPVGAELTRPGGAAATAKPPTLPDRPKPQVPARPARPLRHGSQDGGVLSKSVSNASAGSAEGGVKSPPEVKAKPTIPARPVNANFANLRAGFMNDLNSRLKVGPVVPKTQEEEDEAANAKAVEEKAPLADARKGRARGPARRKPAAASAAATDSSTAGVSDEQKEAAGKSLTLAISTTFTVWSIGEEGDVSVPSTSGRPSVSVNSTAPTTRTVSTADSTTPSLTEARQEVEKIATANTDAAGPPSPTATRATPATSLAESRHEVEAIATSNTAAAGPASPTAAKSTAPFSSDRDQASTIAIANAQSDPVGAEGDASDSAQLSTATHDRADAIAPGLAAALADSRAADHGPATGSTDIASHVSEYSSEVPVSAGREGKDAATAQQTTTALSDAAPAAEFHPPGSFPKDEEVSETKQKMSGGGVHMVDQKAQTGEKEITVRSPTGGEERLTVIHGGRPHDDGHVVVKDGEVQ